MSWFEKFLNLFDSTKNNEIKKLKRMDEIRIYMPYGYHQTIGSVKMFGQPIVVNKKIKELN